MSISWEQQQQKNVPETQEFTNDPILNQKIKYVCAGLPENLKKKFKLLPTDEDRMLLAGFLDACLRQENIKTSTKKTYILGLNYLSKHFDYRKSFKDMTDQDVADFLGSLHENEDINPDRTWINTHNTWASIIEKFFKWVTYPKLSVHERRRLPKDKLPEVLRQLHYVTKTGSKSSYTSKQIWYDEDNVYFYRYCNHNLRLKFYHALAMDTTARPHELLALKIGDIEIKKDLEGHYFVPLQVGKYGKKKEGRYVGMAATAIAFYREYLQKQHPDPNNPNSYVFRSTEYSARNNRNIPISVGALRGDYTKYQKKCIPALLKSPDSDVPQEDKKILKHLQETKKWIPYIARHSSVSRLKKRKMDTEHLKQYAGWTKNSRMLEIYNHEQETDGFESAMLTLGVDVRVKSEEDRRKQEQMQQELSGQYCNFCGMVNVKGAKFCSQCKFPIVIEAAIGQREEAENTKKELAELKTQQQEFEEKIEETMTANFQKMQQEMLRMFRPSLKKIKNEKERNNEMSALLVNADVLDEYDI